MEGIVRALYGGGERMLSVQVSLREVGVVERLVLGAGHGLVATPPPPPELPSAPTQWGDNQPPSPRVEDSLLKGEQVRTPGSTNRHTHPALMTPPCQTVQRPTAVCVPQIRLQLRAPLITFILFLRNTFPEEHISDSRSTGRSGPQKAATRRNMRREERVTVQGPVKEQQPDGMSHRGEAGVGQGSKWPSSPQVGPEAMTWLGHVGVAVAGGHRGGLCRRESFGSLLASVGISCGAMLAVAGCSHLLVVVGGRWGGGREGWCAGVTCWWGSDCVVGQSVNSSQFAVQEF